MTTLLDSLAGPPVGEDANADHRAAGGPGGPDVEVVVPVYNEETDLGPSVRRLYAYLSTAFPFTWRITIADNASIDTTPVVAQSLAEELPGVRVVRLDQKGRGPPSGTSGSTPTQASSPTWMSLHRSGRPVAARGAVDLRAQRRGDRQPAVPWVSSGPRHQARAGLPLLQPAAPHDAVDALLRRPVRLQGNAGRRGPRAATARAGHGLVLGHRDARAGRAGGPAHS